MIVPEEQIEAAQGLQDWYNARQARVSWSDPKSIATFKAQFNMEINTWIEREGIERRVAAAALWRVAHNSRSALAGAASVFLGFPDEVKDIITHNPGITNKRSYATVLIGVHYQVPGLADADLEVQVVEFHISKDGKSVGIKAIVGVLDGQLQPKDPAYPRNMIGCVAANEAQPANGRYLAKLTQASKGSWKVILSSV